MKACTRCRRPLLPVSGACPFCGVKLASTWKVLALAVATPFVLTACYGGPAVDCVGEDADGDGFFLNCDFTEPDCDDGDPEVFPGADEVCDDEIDNDCDGDADLDDADCLAVPE